MAGIDPVTETPPTFGTLPPGVAQVGGSPCRPASFWFEAPRRRPSGGRVERSGVERSGVERSGVERSGVERSCVEDGCPVDRYVVGCGLLVLSVREGGVEDRVVVDRCLQ